MRSRASHPEVATSVIEIRGVKVHHVDVGPSDAQALLLLPGIIATHRYYRDNIAALSRRYRVLAPDLPGFGRSDKPDAPYSMAWFVEQVARFLDEKRLDRVHIAGNSLGGQIAMRFALAHPERLDRLVLVAPAGISTDRMRFASPLLGALGRVAPRARRIVPRIPRTAFSVLFRAVFPDRPDLAERYTRAYTAGVAAPDYPLHFVAAIRAMRGCLDSPMIERAGLIRSPTLIIWGKRDPLLPVSAAPALKRAMPGAELIIYERSGHCPMVDEPERWNRDVEQFLDAG